MAANLNRLYGRIYGWFESKTARPLNDAVPAAFSRRARLALVNLEDRCVPASAIVTTDADSGAGSLRDAITAINASVDPANTITFSSFFNSAKTITLTAALPSLAVPVTITGTQSAGANLVTVSGNGTVGVFDTTAAPAGTAIVFDKLNMTKGFTAAAFPAQAGGGLTIGDEDVTVRDSSITASTARTGGGISMSGLGKLSLLRSSVSGNLSNSATTFEGGGGIYTYVASTVDIQDSTISGNSAPWGGGILFYNGGDVNILNSTLSGNTTTSSSASSRGGAFYAFGVFTAFNVRNSTFSANRSVSGGAVRFQSVGGAPINISNCTFTGNNATSTSTAIGNGGGGISMSGTTNGPNVLNLESCIVSGNTHSGGTAGFHDLSITTNTTLNAVNNAIGASAGFTFNGTNTGNLAFGIDLKLDPTLKTNSSTNGTKTHAILTGTSPLVNAGSNPAALTTDQRGAGFAREVPSGKADIGAFEYVPGNPIAIAGMLPTVNANQNGVNNPYTFTITYTDDTAIDVNTVINNNSAIRVTGPNSFNQLATYVSIDNNTNGSPRTATYSFTPPGGTWDQADNGTYSVAIEGNQVKSTSLATVSAASLGNFFVGVPTTYTVSNTNDAGAGSLRQAILDANAMAGTPDTIVFDPGFFNSSKKTIAPLTALPAIADAVTITGPGANLAVISGGGLLRVLDTSAAPLGAAVTISGLTLTAGSTTGNGGGILVGDEALTLTNVVITNCTALEGGGVSLQSGSASLTMTNSTISGSTASGGDGGAINVNSASNLVINSSTLSGNSAKSDGGAIYFLSGGSLNMTRSTVSGNTASGSAGTYNSGGGAIYFFGAINANGFRISNSTISGNVHTTLSGGGICFDTVTGGTPVITNSTIIRNSAFGNGGGIARSAGTGLLTITSSVVSENIVELGNGPDIDFGSSGATATFSAVGTDPLNSVNDYPNPANSNIPFGAAVNLGPLANNGGPTLTHKPGTGPLINTGANPTPLNPNVDQAGNPRSFGQTDIGAVEVQSVLPPTALVVNGNSSQQRSRISTVQVFLSTPVDASTLGAVSFTRTTPNTGTVVNTSNGLMIAPTSGSTYSLTFTFDNITSAGINFGSLADGYWRLSIPGIGFQSALNDPALRRLFGDVDGNGTVDASDFGFFPPLGAAVGNPFDFNNNGDIDSGTDFSEFGNRFGVTL